MSLIFCPECGHEVSVNAIACPGCGRPIAPQPVSENVVMVPRENSGMPPWAYALIGLSAVSLILAAIVFLRQGSNEDANLNVNVASRRAATTQTVPEPVRETRTSTISSTDSPAVSVPPARTASIPASSVSEPSVPAPPSRGTVKITAKIAPRTGSTQAARGTRFYLLDKDVQTILTEARVEPIEGNDLAASLGLAAVNPERYGDFQRRAMRAIAAHAKSTATTSPNGSASFDGVMPDEYYLFAIARVGSGFAFWNAPVSVSAGENQLDLSPQTVTEILDSDLS